MEFDNVETVKRAVEIDAGISIVPQGAIAQEVQKQTLAAVTIEDGQFFRPTAAIYKKSRVLSPAMKQFLTVLKGSARSARLTAAVPPARSDSRRGCARPGPCRGTRRRPRRAAPWLLQTAPCSGTRSSPVSRARFSG